MEIYAERNMISVISIVFSYVGDTAG